MKIAIIGCGWLGFPLAKKMVEKGHLVFGSTTNTDKLKELEQAGIHSFVYDGKNQKNIPVEVLESDLLVINFPPSKSNDYAAQINHLLSRFDNSCKVIFTSSTSVYVDVEGEIDENSAVKEDHPVYHAEQEIRKSQKHWIILRLAGLLGANRHPVKILSGKKVADANAAVNLIHLNDVLEAIDVISCNETTWDSTYNISWGEHPTKKEYYTKAADTFQIPKPLFEESAQRGKRVNAIKITEDFDFQYSNPI